MIRSISLSTALCFVWTQTVLAIPQSSSVMPDKTPAQQQAASPDASSAMSASDLDALLLINIPDAFGTVQERSQGNSGKIILHIQDTHANYESQMNTANILDLLLKDRFKEKIRLVGVEGAAGRIDVAPLKAYPDKQILKKISDHFVREAYLSGTDFFGIFHDGPTDLQGVEDAQLYLDDLKAFVQSHYAQAQIESALNGLKDVYQKVSGIVYGPRARDFMAFLSGYQKGSIGFARYCEQLADFAEKAGIALTRYEDFQKIVQSLRIEKNIANDSVEKERSLLLDGLQKKMVQEDLTDLLRESLLYRTGKKSSTDFYDYLEKTAGKYGMDWKGLENLHGYMQMVRLQHGIRTKDLLFQCEQIENEVKGSLFSDAVEREFDASIKRLTILDALVHLRLNRSGLDFCQRHKENISGEVLAKFIQSILSTHAVRTADGWQLPTASGQVFIPASALSDAPSIDKQLDSMYSFYSTALLRDEAMVRNTLLHMEQQHLDAAVLITGGFHTEGTMKLLKEKGISYIVINPRLTKTDQDHVYLARMMNKELPIQNLFAQPASRLAIADFLSDVYMQLKGEFNGEPFDLDTGKENKSFGAAFRAYYVCAAAQKIVEANPDITANALKDKLRESLKGLSSEGHLPVAVEARTVQTKDGPAQAGEEIQILFTLGEKYAAALGIPSEFVMGVPASEFEKAQKAAAPGPLAYRFLDRQNSEFKVAPLAALPKPAAAAASPVAAAPEALNPLQKLLEAVTEAAKRVASNADDELAKRALQDAKQELQSALQNQAEAMVERFATADVVAYLKAKAQQELLATILASTDVRQMEQESMILWEALAGSREVSVQRFATASGSARTAAASGRPTSPEDQTQLRRIQETILLEQLLRQMEDPALRDVLGEMLLETGRGLPVAPAAEQGESFAENPHAMLVSLGSGLAKVLKIKETDVRREKLRELWEGVRKGLYADELNNVFRDLVGADDTAQRLLATDEVFGDERAAVLTMLAEKLGRDLAEKNVNFLELLVQKMGEEVKEAKDANKEKPILLAKLVVHFELAAREPQNQKYRGIIRGLSRELSDQIAKTSNPERGPPDKNKLAFFMQLLLGGKDSSIAKAIFRSNLRIDQVIKILSAIGPLAPNASPSVADAALPPSPDIFPPALWDLLSNSQRAPPVVFNAHGNPAIAPADQESVRNGAPVLLMGDNPAETSLMRDKFQVVGAKADQIFVYDAQSGQFRSAAAEIAKVFRDLVRANDTAQGLLATDKALGDDRAGDLMKQAKDLSRDLADKDVQFLELLVQKIDAEGKESKDAGKEKPILLAKLMVHLELAARDTQNKEYRGTIRQLANQIAKISNPERGPPDKNKLAFFMQLLLGGQDGSAKDLAGTITTFLEFAKQQEGANEKAAEPEPVLTDQGGLDLPKFVMFLADSRLQILGRSCSFTNGLADNADIAEAIKNVKTMREERSPGYINATTKPYYYREIFVRLVLDRGQKEFSDINNMVVSGSASTEGTAYKFRPVIGEGSDWDLNVVLKVTPDLEYKPGMTKDEHQAIFAKRVQRLRAVGDRIRSLAGLFEVDIVDPHVWFEDTLALVKESGRGDRSELLSSAECEVKTFDVLGTFVSLRYVQAVNKVLYGENFQLKVPWPDANESMEHVLHQLNSFNKLREKRENKSREKTESSAFEDLESLGKYAIRALEGRIFSDNEAQALFANEYARFLQPDLGGYRSYEDMILSVAEKSGVIQRSTLFGGSKQDDLQLLKYLVAIKEGTMTREDLSDKLPGWRQDLAIDRLEKFILTMFSEAKMQVFGLPHDARLAALIGGMWEHADRLEVQGRTDMRELLAPDPEIVLGAAYGLRDALVREDWVKVFAVVKVLKRSGYVRTLRLMYAGIAKHLGMKIGADQVVAPKDLAQALVRRFNEIIPTAAGGKAAVLFRLALIVDPHVKGFDPGTLSQEQRERAIRVGKSLSDTSRLVDHEMGNYLVNGIAGLDFQMREDKRSIFKDAARNLKEIQSLIMVLGQWPVAQDEDASQIEARLLAQGLAAQKLWGEIEKRIVFFLNSYQDVRAQMTDNAANYYAITYEALANNLPIYTPRFTGEDLVLDLKSLDLAQAIDAIWSVFSKKFNANWKGTKPSLSIPDGVSPNVRADSRYLRAILVNLIKNAAEAAAQNLQFDFGEGTDQAGKKSIVLKIKDDGTGVRIVPFMINAVATAKRSLNAIEEKDKVLTDDDAQKVLALDALLRAAGVELNENLDPKVIPDLLQRKIVDLLFLRKMTFGKAAGTGTGLDVVRSFAEKMGGTITAENNAGQGATFTLTLPAAEQAPVVERLPAQAPAAESMVPVELVPVLARAREGKAPPEAPPTVAQPALPPTIAEPPPQSVRGYREITSTLGLFGVVVAVVSVGTALYLATSGYISAVPNAAESFSFGGALFKILGVSALVTFMIKMGDSPRVRSFRAKYGKALTGLFFCVLGAIVVYSFLHGLGILGVGGLHTMQSASSGGLGFMGMAGYLQQPSGQNMHPLAGELLSKIKARGTELEQFFSDDNAQNREIVSEFLWRLTADEAFRKWVATDNAVQDYFRREGKGRHFPETPQEWYHVLFYHAGPVGQFDKSGLEVVSTAPWVSPLPASAKYVLADVISQRPHALPAELLAAKNMVESLTPAAKKPVASAGPAAAVAQVRPEASFASGASSMILGIAAIALVLIVVSVVVNGVLAPAAPALVMSAKIAPAMKSLAGAAVPLIGGKAGMGMLGLSVNMISMIPGLRGYGPTDGPGLKRIVEQSLDAQNANAGLAPEQTFGRALDLSHFVKIVRDEGTGKIIRVELLDNVPAAFVKLLQESQDIVLFSHLIADPSQDAQEMNQVMSALGERYGKPRTSHFVFNRVGAKPGIAKDEAAMAFRDRVYEGVMKAVGKKIPFSNIVIIPTAQTYLDIFKAEIRDILLLLSSGARRLIISGNVVDELGLSESQKQLGQVKAGEAMEFDLVAETRASLDDMAKGQVVGVSA